MDMDEKRRRREDIFERTNALKEAAWKVSMDKIENNREYFEEGVLAVNRKRDVLEEHDDESGALEEGIVVKEEGDMPVKKNGVEEDTSKEDVEEEKVSDVETQCIGNEVE